ncbi:hypothetical protein [Streptomyces sp. VRA16 Mangrove soil]|uniref:hypothetical protein n=1 Tax=Streptomyces sp. VRA16 Mangrove soil TaxID=2817434 RepID=UPI001A9FCD03|nr:hypothetical protein [Streptomyces sp. VRA16 Mangrove soil]MBO1336296.1 hypothetical protein [Streptomyces sp. VRA16 Mangrove soil]
MTDRTDSTDRPATRLPGTRTPRRPTRTVIGRRIITTLRPAPPRETAWELPPRMAIWVRDV